MFRLYIMPSARRLRRSGVAAIAAIVTIAIALGALTTVYSVVYGVLLRPLPHRDEERLVVVRAAQATTQGSRPASFSLAEFEALQTRLRFVESIAASVGDAVALSTEQGAEKLLAAHVSASYFRTAGAPLRLGRGVSTENEPVVVVSERLWLTRLEGRPDVIGKGIRLNGMTYTVVGVAGSEFGLPSSRIDVWMPLAYALSSGKPEWLANRDAGGFQLLARLDAHRSTADLHAQLTGILGDIERQSPVARRGKQILLISIREHLAGPARRLLLAASVAGGFVLLIACANVAGLMLAQQATYVREIAVRAALGESRPRLLWHAITDSALVTAAGAAAGCTLAAWGVQALRWARPSQIPRIDQVELGVPVLVFMTGAAAAAALLSGVVPAALSFTPDVASVLKANSRSAFSSQTTKRWMASIVVMQLATAIALLVAAIMVGRHLSSLLRSDLGVRSSNVLVVQVDAAMGGDLPSPRLAFLLTDVERAVSRMQKADTVGIGAAMPPLGVQMRTTFDTSTRASGGVMEYTADIVPASPGFLRTLGIRLVEGRIFEERDTMGAPSVALLSATAARELFGMESAIGRELPVGPKTDSGEPTVATVVGVVADVRYSGPGSPPNGVVYRPFSQVPWQTAFVAVRTSGPPTDVAQDVRRLIRQAAPDLNVVRIAELDTLLAEAVVQPAFRTTLLGSLAAIGLALGAVGLYGVLAFSVNHRTPELALRSALGASRWQVLRLVLVESAWLTGSGLVAGLLAAHGLTRYLESLLFDLVPTDFTSFAFATGVVGVIAAIAVWLPARRAMAVDPAATLRNG